MKKSDIKIGVMVHQFLRFAGANDFLKFLIRGLVHNNGCIIYLLVPDSPDSYPMPDNHSAKFFIDKFNFLPKAIKNAFKKLNTVTSKMSDNYEKIYAQYILDPRIRVVPCAETADGFRKAIAQYSLDVLFPSIHNLPSDICYVTYWPDCQHRHWPQFFDAPSIDLRDACISSLLNTGKPMIMNSMDAKNDMVKFFSAIPTQIFALPFTPLLKPEILKPIDIIAKYKLPKRYFAVSNQFWIHKSLETVFEAISILKNRGEEVFVVFTGEMAEYRVPGYIDILLKIPERLGISNNIKLLGFIPKRHQEEIIKNSVAVIQPTLFEGGPGGGSVYDAVAMGIRAIVSDIPINFELPLQENILITFKKKDAFDLADKMSSFWNTVHVLPPKEKLIENSQQRLDALSKKIFEAIDAAINTHSKF